MGDAEEQESDLLNIDQEDDNLLGISPVNAESSLLPSLTPKKALQQGSMENCYGHDATICAPVVAGAGLAPVPCMTSNSVLSVLNFNEINKRSVNRDNIEESWLRKDSAVKESIHLDGIAEASAVTFSSRLSRSYLDIENEQGGMTPGKRGGEPTILRKGRSRRSTTLRKSLAWDKAFFTDEGVLNNDELFAAASDTPKTLAMPELATIWDRPQTDLAPFEANATPTKCELRSELRSEVKKELIPEVRRGMCSALRPEGRPAVNPKSQQDVSHTPRRPDILHTSSLRPVRQIHTSGLHTVSNSFSRAAAIPQGSTSLPLQNSLPKTGKRLEADGRNPTESFGGTVSDQMREPRSTSTGLHHQARIAALKKAHEAPLLKAPGVRLPTSNSNKKAEDRQLEEIEKAKQPKKVENKHLQEVHILKQSKAEVKPSDEMHQMHTTPKMKLELTRSMSTSALLDSPSALSRKVSFMSKKVKETLGKVMTGRAGRVRTEPLLSRIHPVEKVSMLSKRSCALPTVPEVKDPSHRTKSNAAVVPVKPSKDIFTVRDILRSKGPPSAPEETFKQGPTLLRSKSACGVPDVRGATDPCLAPSVSPPPPPPPVQPSEPDRKPTGLRKPSPKLGFFDAGRVSSAPPKGCTFSHSLQGVPPVRTGSEASIPTEQLGQRRLHGFALAKISSAIPSAPHLRHEMISAPTSPKGIHVMHPSSSECSSTTRRPASPNIGGADLLKFSGIRHAEQFAESHQLLSKRILLGDMSGTVSEASVPDSFKLPVSLSTSGDLSIEPVEDVRDGVTRNIAESSLYTTPAVKFGGPAHCGSRLELSGAKSGGNTTRRAGLIGLQNSNCYNDFGDSQTEKHSSLETTYDYPGPYVSDRELRIVSMGPMSSPHERPDNSRPFVGQRTNEVTKVADLPCDSPRSRRSREPYAEAVNICGHTSKASRDKDLPASGCPGTPTSRDDSHAASRKVSKKLDSPRCTSFRETSLRTNSSTDSPVAASKHILRNHSQRVPWQSPGGKVIGDSSSSVRSVTLASGGKRLNIVSPSYSPDSAGTLEVLTPSSSKNARGNRAPSSSGRKAVRKIIEFESPSSQWSNWPVLGAVISADQLPVSAKEGSMSSVSPRPLREQATEQSAGARPNNSASSPRTPSLKAKHVDLERVSHEQCSSAMDQSTQSRLCFSTGFVTSPSNAMSAETDRVSMDRNPAPGLIESEIFPVTPASAKKEKCSSMFSFARMAVSRLTSSPAPSDSSAQEDEATPKSSRKTNRRFSRPGSSSNSIAPEPKPLSPFSEARICELEAAGPEVLEKKSGPVQNSPPDKVISESNPWSPVRKNGQPLGPFDCTKLKYISPVLSSS